MIGPGSEAPVFDLRAAMGADLRDLDLGAMERHVSRCSPEFRGGQKPDLLELAAALGLLRKTGDEFCPTIAGLLVFGRRPQQLLPQNSLAAVRFKGHDTAGLIVDQAEFGGPLEELINWGVQFVARNMRTARLIRAVQAEDIPEYSLDVAVREAIANAVVHRDYSLTGRKTQIRMFDDRLEIENHGALAGRLTLPDLGTGAHYSRNPTVVRTMLAQGLIDEPGTGIRRIRESVSRLEGRPPEFAVTDRSFQITLWAIPLEERVADAAPG